MNIRRFIAYLCAYFKDEPPVGFIRDDFYLDGMATCVDPLSDDYGIAQYFERNSRGDIRFRMGWKDIKDFNKIHYLMYVEMMNEGNPPPLGAGDGAPINDGPGPKVDKYGNYWGMAEL